MLLELAKPIALTLCLLSLYAVFHSAFLVPAIDWQQKIFHSIELLAISAVIAFIGGVVFLDATPRHALAATLPVRIFCWAAGIMTILFIISWYLETSCSLCRDLRY